MLSFISPILNLIDSMNITKDSLFKLSNTLTPEVNDSKKGHPPTESLLINYLYERKEMIIVVSLIHQTLLIGIAGKLYTII